MPKILALLTVILFGPLAYGTTPEQWHQLSVEKKTEFHRLLLKSLSEADSKARINPKAYTVTGGIFRGIASRKACVYGGWISSTREGVCRHPYYVSKSYQPCGMKGVHRCNPAIFGGSNEKSFPGSKPGKGICVEAKNRNSDSSSMTWACIKAAYGSGGGIDVERFRNHLRDLSGDSRYLGEYLAHATQIVEEHCSENADDFCVESAPERSCKRLRDSFFHQTAANPALIGCRGGDHEILLGKAYESIFDAQRATKVYFPLIEESQAWKKIRDMERVTGMLRDENFWNLRCNPYDIIRNNRIPLKRKGYRRCRMGKNLLEESMIAKTPWGSMSLGDRAEKIHQLTQDSFQAVKTSTPNLVVKSREFKGAERIDGNVFHGEINPDVASCFMYHETKGHLHPFKYNYTYCYKKTTSTAYGLGQITRSTLEDLLNFNDGSNLPMVTPEAKKFFWPGDTEEEMDGEDIHRYMNLSPKFQTELVLRILNRKAKVVNKNYKDNYTLEYLIRGYYGCNRATKKCRDGTKKYYESVRPCVECFQKGRPASDCYYIMEKCGSDDCKEAVARGDFTP